MQLQIKETNYATANKLKHTTHLQTNEEHYATAKQTLHIMQL
jgi:hypothetical protein